jgi:polyisoprenoid-binding protein YceI
MNKALILVAALAAAGCATSTPPVPDPGLNAPAVADTPIKSPPGEYRVDPLHTSVVWKVQHLGLALYTARFDKSAGVLNLDSAAPTKSTVTFTIDAHSVSTPLPTPGKANFDAEIAKGLGADKAPEIKFVSTSLVRTGEDSGAMTGDLTLNGVTKPATFKILLRGEGVNPLTQKPAIGVQGYATIKRSDWGVDFAKLFTGDDVVIEIDSELDKK